MTDDRAPGTLLRGGFNVSGAAFEVDPSWPTIEELAVRLWGKVTGRYHGGNELRFGANESKSVKVKECVWHDHESGTSGGYIKMWGLLYPGTPLPPRTGQPRPAPAAPPKPAANGHADGNGKDRTPPWEDVGVVYPYRAATGDLILQVVRTISRKPRFRQRRPDGTLWNGETKWKWNVSDIPGHDCLLYRLPELLASPDATVFVTEGEKDADNLTKLGLTATTGIGGSGKWRDEYAEVLRDRDVVILPDNDAPGTAHAETAARSLRGVAASVRVLMLPDLAPKGDVSDWIEAGGTKAELEWLVDAQAPWAPPAGGWDGDGDGPPMPPGGEPPPPDDDGPPPPEDGKPERSAERFGPPTLADLSVDDLAAMDEIAFGRIAKAKADLLEIPVGALRAARNAAKAAAKAKAKDREQEAKRQAKQQEREGDVAKRRARHARLPDWLKKLARDDTGKPIPDLANAMTALSEAPELRDLLAYDEMARAPVLLAPVPGTKNTETPHPLNDIDVGAIQNWIQRAAIRRLAKDIVHQASELRADQNRFHPVRRYLDALVWDGTPRLDKWLSYYLGVERIRKAAPSGEDYVDAIGRMFLISGVARIFDPGCQCDYMLVLEGTQGNLKSSACAILAGEWFSDHLPDLHTSQKDVSQHLNGKWIVEIPELAALLKADESLIKSFITRRVERYRRSYGRRDVFESRQCVFIGTTNLEAYLRDPTGGRRFWPVKVGVIDLKALKTDRDQLWAEAVVRYRAGEKYWPDAKFEREQIQEQQEARFDEDVWTDPIREHLKGQVQTTVMQMAVALGFTNEEVGTRDQRRISAILERFGWVRHRTGKQRWWVPMGNGRQ